VTTVSAVGLAEQRGSASPEARAVCVRRWRSLQSRALGGFLSLEALPAVPDALLSALVVAGMVVPPSRLARASRRVVAEAALLDLDLYARDPYSTSIMRPLPGCTGHELSNGYRPQIPQSMIEAAEKTSDWASRHRFRLIVCTLMGAASRDARSDQPSSGYWNNELLIALVLPPGTNSKKTLMVQQSRI